MAEIKRLHTPQGTPPSRRTLLAPSHSHQLLNALRHMFEDEHLCDYTIIAEGQAYRTHRNILASVSDYFCVMLTGSMIESRQDHVELKGVTANAIKVLLDFAYTGQLSLSLDDIGEVLAGACHLQIRTGIELCCDFLLSEICARTCVDILNIAEMFTLMEVRALALKYVLHNFEKISDSDQFYKLNPEHVHLLLESDDLRCSSELNLFGHVTKWIDYDHEERGKEATSLLPLIRFSLMRPEELVDKVSQTQAMLSDPKCRVLLDEALHYHVLPSRHPVMQTPRSQVRNQPCMIAFGGRYGISVGYKNNSNKMYALHEGKWVKLPSSDSNFLYAAVAVLDNFLYVCGGMGKPAHARATCQRFDPRTGTWTRIAHMKTRRQSFSLVAYNGHLYALGGGTPCDSGFDHPPTDKCESYSIDQNDWTNMAALPELRKSTGACEHKGKIYISGGRKENETVCSLWCYDPEQDVWEVKSPMLLPHAGHAMLTVQDTIYVMDRTNLAIESYNPAMDDWTKICTPSTPLSGIARPAVFGPWVYFLSYIKETRDFQCRRINVLTRQKDELPPFPDQVHCVIGAPLALPRRLLVDSNNNNSNHENNTSTASSTSTFSGSVS